MSKPSRFRAQGEPDNTWRIWDEKRSKFWGHRPFPVHPGALVAELNGEARPEELAKLVRMLRPDEERAANAEKSIERPLPARDERRRVLAPHQRFVDDVSALLFRHDPVTINFEHNTDEYDPEADTIVMRLVDLESTPSVDQLQKVVHEEFCRWFDTSAGPRERYREIAVELRPLLASSSLTLPE